MFYFGKNYRTANLGSNWMQSLSLAFGLCFAQMAKAGPNDVVGKSDDAIQTQWTSLSFSTDWKTGVNGKGGYSALQTIDADRLFPLNSCPGRKDFTCVRVTVKPGDFLSSGERSEVLQMSDSNGKAIFENNASGIKYYALSAYFPDSWKSPTSQKINGQESGVWGAFFQLHGPDSLRVSPSFGFMAEDVFSINVRGGNLATNTKNTKYYLSNSAIPKNKWVDFVIAIRFSKENKGSISVWRHDQGETNFIKVLAVENIATLQYADGQPVGDHYWKSGLYRSPSPFVSQFYLGPQARGESPAAVAAFAFKDIGELNRINWGAEFK
jgi:hypothetical protein